jgi:hypothetical protein
MNRYETQLDLKRCVHEEVDEWRKMNDVVSGGSWGGGSADTDARHLYTPSTRN